MALYQIWLHVDFQNVDEEEEHQQKNLSKKSRYAWLLVYSYIRLLLSP